MSGKIILFCVGVILFFGLKTARAEVFLSEVQIAGSTVNDEFIELYNSGDAAVDLTGYYIKKKTSTGSENNFIVAGRFEGAVISSGGYLLLAREKEYAGTVAPDIFWPASYSLASNNSLILYRGSQTDKDEAGWETIGENLSLQKNSSGSWTAVAPTPKEANITESVPLSQSDDNSGSQNDSADASSDNDSDSSDSNNETSPPKKEQKPKESKKPDIIKAKIIANSSSFTGQPLEMKASISGSSGVVALGRIYWNFGDGGSFEQKNNFEAFNHIYQYPGDYAVSLEYYQNDFSKTPEASAKMTIKVIPTVVVISRVGDAKDFFIELSNNAPAVIDVSNWFLSANGKTFVLPKNSVIMPKKQITLPGNITGLSYNDRSSLKLFSSTGAMVFDSSIIVAVPKQETEKPIVQKISSAQNNKIPTKTPSPVADPAPVENLPAFAAQSIPPEDDSQNLYLPMLLSFVLIGASAGAAYFIRRKRAIPKIGDDFEILDS